MYGADCQARENAFISLDSTSSLLFFYRAKKVHTDICEERFVEGNPVFRQLCHELLLSGCLPLLAINKPFQYTSHCRASLKNQKPFFSELIRQIPDPYGPPSRGCAGLLAPSHGDHWVEYKDIQEHCVIRKRIVTNFLTLDSI